MESNYNIKVTVDVTAMIIPCGTALAGKEASIEPTDFCRLNYRNQGGEKYKFLFFQFSGVNRILKLPKKKSIQKKFFLNC
jgi:hypothetical protein